MKDGEKKPNMINFLAFVALVIFAVLQVLINLLKTQGGLITVLEAIKNLCVVIVFGVTGYKFVKGKSKGYLYTYWISLAVFIVSSVLILL